LWCFWLIDWCVDELFVSKEVKAAEDLWKLHQRLSIEMGVGPVQRDSSFKRIRKELTREAYGTLSGRSTEVPGGATTKETFAVLLEPVTNGQVVRVQQFQPTNTYTRQGV
jgi:hypothetical protein